jgi:ribosomal protein L11 methyltransferase
MRELVLTVPAAAVEEVLDRLLPLLPSGVREEPRGREVVLRIRDPEVALDTVRRAAGRFGRRLTVGEVPDAWQARRRLDYRPERIGGRLVVRPEWAPPDQAAEIELVLGESSAFGSGGHPTTHTCLELLLEQSPGGSFADLGCGSGVLAILAAHLGYRPVFAIDQSRPAVRAAEANAAANRVRVELAVEDLRRAAPPAAETVFANVPAAVHVALAAAFVHRPPRTLVLSGIVPEEGAGVAEAYGRAGLTILERRDVAGWAVMVLG